MADDGLLAYANHPAWDHVEEARVRVKGAEVPDSAARERLYSTLTTVLLARGYFGTYAHIDVLDRIDSLTHQLADDASIHAFTVNGYLQSLYELVRLLPPPQVQDLTPKVQAALQALLELNEREIQQLRDHANEAMGLATSATAAARKVQVSVDAARDAASSAKGTIEETARAAKEQFDHEWEVKLDAWRVSADQAENKRDETAQQQLAALIAAVATSQSLVEQAAGDLVATEWVDAARKHRLGAKWALWGGVAAFVGATVVVVAVAGLGAAETAREEFQWGTQIVRLAAATPLLAIGAFLFSERSRLNREADSAQDVATLVRNFDSFFQTSEPDKRKAAREELGKVLFGESLRSRFSSRDAAKHAGLNTNDVQQMVELAKGFGAQPRS